MGISNDEKLQQLRDKHPTPDSKWMFVCMFQKAQAKIQVRDSLLGFLLQ